MLPFFRHVFFALSVGLSLSGCASFKVPYKPEDGGWSVQKGTNTLVMRAFLHNELGKVEPCDANVPSAYLLPDTPYFRNWIDIVQTQAYFKSFPSKQAQLQMRKGDRVEYCTFVFKDLPAGKWIFLTDLNHSISPRRVTVGTGNGYFQTIQSTTGFRPIWTPIEVPDSTTPTYRQVSRDIPRSRSIFYHAPPKNYAFGSLSDWTPPRDELTDLSSYIATGKLPDSSRPNTASAY